MKIEQDIKKQERDPVTGFPAEQGLTCAPCSVQKPTKDPVPCFNAVLPSRLKNNLKRSLSRETCQDLKLRNDFGGFPCPSACYLKTG